jgi:hypothetical protein
VARGCNAAGGVSSTRPPGRSPPSVRGIDDLDAAQVIDHFALERQVRTQALDEVALCGVHAVAREPVLAQVVVPTSGMPPSGVQGQTAVGVVQHAERLGEVDADLMQQLRALGHLRIGVGTGVVRTTPRLRLRRCRRHSRQIQLLNHMRMRQAASLICMP